jgi:hypothetical protein
MSSDDQSGIDQPSPPPPPPAAAADEEDDPLGPDEFQRFIHATPTTVAKNDTQPIGGLKKLKG